MRKRVERESGTHCVSGVNPSTGLVDAPNRNYFSQNTPFFILQLCLAPFFNFFPLSDLKYNIPKFWEKSDFFEKISDFSDFSAKNRRFFPDFCSFDFFCQNRFHADQKLIFFVDKSAEKSDFLFTNYSMFSR